AAFDYDRDTGALTEERTFATVPDHEAPPDGLTVDAGGFVWSARYGGGEIARYRSDGTEERRIALPGAKNITSLAFGGENYEDLYVTTAGAEDREKNGVSAGALFRVRVNGVHGLPPYRSRIAVTPPQG
ncbi:MAG: SMP-30/gluconolactonase/LRE family protein, partial [Cytophagales bacterium]|nr:SMP-30/gluconolactonase/LRE family protein [Armatimonadota bacterium]